ncbi:MAG: 16S rRNA (cytidine(1402)-2'-O)-methyltransferase [Pseudomonadota bacterium]
MTPSTGQDTAPQTDPPVQTVPLAAGLYIVSTPIGNLRDITLRALDTLTAADEILAEDTRVTRKLLTAYGIHTRLTAYHDHNGAERRPGVLAALQAGATIALVSDAGTPLISDPGFKLVRDAADCGVAIIPVPGASAMLAGLVVAGLPTDRFLFAGFLPQKAAARRRALEALAPIDSTLILYEAGSRLTAMLSDAAACLGGNRPVAVSRELTKRFEETRRDTLEELAAHYAGAGSPKGELVVMIGPPENGATREADLDRFLEEGLASMSVKAASEAAARALGVPRRQAYQRALELKRQRNEP